MRNIVLTGVACAAIALTGCQQESPSDEADIATVTEETPTTGGMVDAESATAALQTADGTSVGEARISRMDGGLNLILSVTGMPPGNHGVHIHQTGKCDAPDFKSAGGHWNPTDKEHGLANDNGSHMGDFVNLEVAADGTGSLERPIKGATLEGGANALLDSDGAAFIVHAGQDDQMTDPSGDSGDRIACGVFEKTAS